ncbi:MAG: glycosyltransferase family 39 protein [Candidatus Altiarchaeota archaeon]|nr:glycosyltransferase family 39 protein [Candidatus Altiarchaeota archaeon]
MKATSEDRDLFVTMLLGLLALVISALSITHGQDLLGYLRWVVSLPFLFLASGYPLTTIFYRRFGAIGIWERIALSSGFSMLLAYPAGLLNILALERKTNIFRQHLVGFLLFLFLTCAITCTISLYLRRKKDGSFCDRECLPCRNLGKKISRRPNQLMILILLVSLLLNLANLDRADIYGDEYSISFIAYDLVDGNTPGREAYMISTKSHSPLVSYISHGAMQVLDPTGYYNLADWMIRFSNAIAGTLAVLMVFILSRYMFGEKVGLISAAFFGVNNYTVWLSRIFHREIFVVLFTLFAIYAFYRFTRTERRRDMWLSGVLLGAAFLVKFTAIFLVPTFLLFVLLKRRSLLFPLVKIFLISVLVFSPVLVFNAGAYVTTGYMDLALSKIFGANSYMGDYSPGAAFDPYNLQVMVFNLADIYSIPISLLFAACFLAGFNFLKKYGEPLLLIWIFTIILVIYFWFLGVRSYYTPFFTIPFAITAGLIFYKLKNALSGKSAHLDISSIILLLLLAWSAFYSYNTNISDSFMYAPEPGMGELGRSDSPLVIPDGSLFSREARVTVESYGFKELSAYLETHTESGQVVLIDDRIDVLAAEWYFEGKQWNLTYGGPVPLGRLPARGVVVLKLTEGYGLQRGDYAVLASEDLPLVEVRFPEGYPEAVAWARNGGLIRTLQDRNNDPSFYVYQI